jgi:hypothetical protein
MGLDITAYSHLERIGRHEKDPVLNEGEPGGPDDYCYYDGHVEAYAYVSFSQSFRGIPVISTDDNLIKGGCFALTAATETHGFQAGSYGGYNHWRADLQRQFNPSRDPDGPFYELIWFADNEGSIGPDAARDLLADFREHAAAYVPPQDWPGEKYQDWTRAFELAADDGLVCFH